MAPLPPVSPPSPTARSRLSLDLGVLLPCNLIGSRSQSSSAT